MQSLIIVRRISLIVIALVAGNARAQNLHTTAPLKVVQTAEASCPNTLSLNTLENDQAITAAAQSLAAQIVGRYIADNENPPSLGKQLWGPFHAQVLAAMQPTCVKKTAALNAVKSAETKAASAKAITGQTSKQVGAPPSADGSTTAVQKVGIPELLGIAVESGAVTNSVTGTTMTLSTSPYAFAVAFGKDTDTEENYRRFHLATQMGISASFNVASSSNPLASATRKQVSDWQMKITFRDTSTRSSAVNRLYEKPGGLGEAATSVAADLSDSRFIGPEAELEPAAEAVYQQAWTSSLKSLVAQAPAAGDTDQSEKQKGIAKELLQLLDKDAPYQHALADALNDLQKDSPADLSALVQKLQLDNTTYANLESEFEKDVQNLTKGWNGDITFGQKFPTTTAAAATNSNGTTTTSPPIPSYLFGELDVTCDPKTAGGSVPAAKGVPIVAAGKGSNCFLFSHGSWTGNFSSSFYTNPNSALNEETFRGATVALQAQWSLGPGFVQLKSANDKSQMTISANGSYQRLQENKDHKGKRPDIVLGNLRLEIPVSSGVSFPLSFSVANATEQIKETYVKGNFGISFDLDKLASLLKAQ